MPSKIFSPMCATISSPRSFIVFLLLSVLFVCFVCSYFSSMFVGLFVCLACSRAVSEVEAMLKSQNATKKFCSLQLTFAVL